MSIVQRLSISIELYVNLKNDLNKSGTYDLKNSVSDALDTTELQETCKDGHCTEFK